MKVIKRAYRFRLYPNDSQEQLIEKTFDCSRQVYNDFLSRCKKEFEKDNGFSINKYDLIKLLPGYKEKYPYLKEVDSIALQQTVIHLYDAYKRYFEHQTNIPTYKKKSNTCNYVTMINPNSVHEEKSEIQIPKIGKVKFVYHRKLPKSFRCSSLSVSRTGKHYYVSLIGEEEYRDYQKYSKESLDYQKSTGLDFSLANLFISDSKIKAGMPKFYKNSVLKLAKEQRKLSNMKKGSNNYKEQLLRIANIHEKISNQRKDFLHKASRHFANKYDYIFVEDLDLKEMSNKKKELKLGLFINDLSYGTFVNFLTYKLEWLNKKIIKVDKFFPSSQLCSECGYQNKDLKLKSKTWICPNCNAKHDRDDNAAINIKKEGIRLVLNSRN